MIKTDEKQYNYFIPIALKGCLAPELLNILDIYSLDIDQLIKHYIHKCRMDLFLCFYFAWVTFLIGKKIFYYVYIYQLVFWNSTIFCFSNSGKGLTATNTRSFHYYICYFNWFEQRLFTNLCYVWFFFSAIHMAACQEHFPEKRAHILKKDIGNGVGNGIRKDNVKTRNIKLLCL